MGRGDGTGRLVSTEGADDSGTGILHVDMDAFFAAVEVLDDPSLRGRPVIVGAAESRGVVSSATYEARRFGVRSAMPVAQALRLCPAAVTLRPRFDRYVEVSGQVMRILRDVTPLVEPLSIDEAFLDVRGARRLLGSPGAIAVELRRRILHDTGLIASVGVAATKHVAKMASTLSKPDGLLIVPAADTQRFLARQRVGALWGVGPKAVESLAGRGIHTVADVLQTPRGVLERCLGQAMGERVWQLARGIDPREVQTSRAEKSIGHEETFRDDVADPAVLRAELLRLADRVGVRLREGDWQARTVAIKVRFADFTTISRSVTLDEATAVSRRIAAAAHELFSAVELRLPVRLIGVRAENLLPAGAMPLGLWDDDESWRRLDDAMDGAVARFGRGAVTRAAFVGRRGPGAFESTPLRPHGSE